MSKASRVQPADAVVAAILSQLHDAFLLLENQDQALELITTLLTPSEVLMVSKRLEITRRYLKGDNYQLIKDKLKVSDGTIARISNQLPKNKTIRKILGELDRIEKKRQSETKPRYEPIDKYLASTRAVEDIAAKTLSKITTALKMRSRAKKIRSKLINKKQV